MNAETRDILVEEIERLRAELTRAIASRDWWRGRARKVLSTLEELETHRLSRDEMDTYLSVEG